ncbi:hypothetical protein GCM10018777_61690 [Streptomyces albogriseolus]|nr:hypothetical protein GCM10018777_61690 [Streptomyces viridodiastaticus]
MPHLVGIEAARPVPRQVHVPLLLGQLTDTLVRPVRVAGRALELGGRQARVLPDHAHGGSRQVDGRRACAPVKDAVILTAATDNGRRVLCSAPHETFLRVHRISEVRAVREVRRGTE